MDFNSSLSKDNIKMAHIYIKGYSTWFSHQENVDQKHFTFTRMAAIKKTVTSVDEEVEKSEPSQPAGENTKS